MLRSRLLAGLVLLLTGSLAHGTEPPTETARTEKNGGLSLDDQLKMKVTVASAKPGI